MKYSSGREAVQESNARSRSLLTKSSIVVALIRDPLQYLAVELLGSYRDRKGTYLYLMECLLETRCLINRLESSMDAKREIADHSLWQLRQVWLRACATVLQLRRSSTAIQHRVFNLSFRCDKIFLFLGTTSFESCVPKTNLQLVKAQHEWL